MVIQIDEDTGVKKIKKFYEKLKGAVNSEPDVVLDFSNVKRIDLSFAQVIIAADREMKKKNGSIALKSASKQVQKQLSLVDF